jgi:hypothetical protein
VPTVPLTTTDHAYLLDNAGEYVVADQTAPNQPLVTTNASLTSNARHVITRASATIVARSSGRDVYSRGGIAPLSTPNPSLIVQPLPSGGTIITTAFLTEGGIKLLTESGSYLSYP